MSDTNRRKSRHRHAGFDGQGRPVEEWPICRPAYRRLDSRLADSWPGIAGLGG